MEPYEEIRRWRDVRVAQDMPSLIKPGLKCYQLTGVTSDYYPNLTEKKMWALLSRCKTK